MIDPDKIARDTTTQFLQRDVLDPELLARSVAHAVAAAYGDERKPFASYDNNNREA